MSEKLHLYLTCPDLFLVLFSSQYRALGGIWIVEGIMSNPEPIKVYTGISTGCVLTLCSFIRYLSTLDFGVFSQSWIQSSMSTEGKLQVLSMCLLEVTFIFLLFLSHLHFFFDEASSCFFLVFRLFMY